MGEGKDGITVHQGPSVEMCGQYDREGTTAEWIRPGCLIKRIRKRACEGMQTRNEKIYLKTTLINFSLIVFEVSVAPYLRLS